jgi:carbon-monoxide dehydrogenase medium subunit
MKPAPFNLHLPTSIDAALTLLADLADDGAMVLAGGQSMVPMMALRVAYPSDLIDINGIAELNRITVEDGHLVIGALARHNDFQCSVAPEPLGRLLTNVASYIAHYPIRTRGTFCGSLAHSDPASEWCLTAATLGAELVLRSISGTRVVPFSDFLDGPMMTLREPEELLVEARLPLPHVESHWGFYEFNRRAGDFALGAAITGYLLQDGLMRDVRIGLGAIEEVPRRIEAVEAALEGKAPTQENILTAAKIARSEVVPMEDFATSAGYRRDLAETVIVRALRATKGAGELMKETG